MDQKKVAKKGFNRFQKGNPGGPGRKKGVPKMDLSWMTEFCNGEGKELLQKWAKCGNGKVAMQALTLLYAYAAGRPTENHNVSGRLSLEDLVAGANEMEDENA